MTKTHLKVKTLGESVLPDDSDRIKGWQGECVLYDLHISSCSTLCYWSTAVDLWITDTLRHMKVELRLPNKDWVSIKFYCTDEYIKQGGYESVMTWALDQPRVKAFLEAYT